jgi:hypothetical protein
LGDQQDKNGRLELTHIAHECAYEHWHRMLFARFLAENGLLIEPDSGVAISLDECKELAKDAGTDLWTLAGRYAQGMLPQIFRPDDPLLQITLAREHQLDLERKLDGLSADVFTASDSLGWCYQFWQAEKKDQVNASGEKIGADELPAVTQLFTEDYMVDFLLDNTLGAWWWGRYKEREGSGFRVQGCKSEADCRRLIALPGCPWKYLRFVKDEKTGWHPAAGTFEGWPKMVKALKCLDPCMGSGHFEVAMFERLVALRMADECLNEKDAVAAVIRDNLFGLEIDPRCTQIAAFNLALAAWRRVGYCALPEMNIACSGLAPNSTKDDWLELAGDSEKLQRGMGRLFDLFQNAPVLGSLIDPRAGENDLLVAAFHELQPLLEKALAVEAGDNVEHEMAVTARGLAKAAEILADRFTLVATNVPYLGRGKQHDVLMAYCDRAYPDAKADLATCFVERCAEFSAKGGVAALVTPQIWLFLGGYKALRAKLLDSLAWLSVVRLGSGAFETISGEVVNAALFVLAKESPLPNLCFTAFDVADIAGADGKAEALLTCAAREVKQADQRRNPDARVTLTDFVDMPLLGKYCISTEGLSTGDRDRFIRSFWENEPVTTDWDFFQGPADASDALQGFSQILFWERGVGVLSQYDGARVQGHAAWNRPGVLVGRMSRIRSSLYGQMLFDKSCVVLTPRNVCDLPAIYSFCCSSEFESEIRKLDKKIGVATSVPLKVPIDLPRWQKVASKKKLDGLMKPCSSDPTQWLFDGHPMDSEHPLHVAVARLLDYQWPRQAGSSFPDCPALETDALAALADEDGVVCIPSVRGEEPAAERLRRLLAKAYGKAWTASKEREMITATGSAAADLEEWLRTDFFSQHCDLFHQRPFVWHIWDGRKRDGFHVLVNYHKLANGAKGRKLLEKLTHAYLNDWIGRQRDGVKRGEGGAEERLAAAEELKARLVAIIGGEPPFDIFVRWKPLHKQSIGWEPDINDGVRLNIRPFLASDIPGGKKGAGILRWKPNIKWDKDRGKEPARPKGEFPWFWKWDEATEDFMGGREFDGNRWNDCHYTNAAKRKTREE